jgi:hypothetical protein
MSPRRSGVRCGGIRDRARRGWRHRRSAFPRRPCCLCLALEFATGEDRSFAFLISSSLSFQTSPRAAVAGLVFEQQDVVFSGRGAKVSSFRLLPIVDRQDRHGGGLRVWRQKRADMQHGAQWNVPQVRRCAVITHDGIRQQRERMRSGEAEDAQGRHANAATSIRMIHKDEFAAVGVRFFQRRELPRFGAEGFVRSVRKAQTKNEEPRTTNKEPHSAMTLLLSPNWSVSTPMRWAMRRSRLLMWASVLAGRLQSW